MGKTRISDKIKIKNPKKAKYGYEEIHKFIREFQSTWWSRSEFHTML